MSCLNSVLTRCHKLIQLSVTTSGAFTPVFLLYSSNHFMVSYKSHHMFIYQPFLLLICVHQCFFADSVDHPWYACGYLEDFIFSSTGEQILFHSRICHVGCNILPCFCSVQAVQYDVHIDSLSDCCITLNPQLPVPPAQRASTLRTDGIFFTDY